MPLLETLTLDVGASIAKALLKRWLNNANLSDAGSSIIDVLKNNTADRIAQQRAQRQFEMIGEKVAENLLPIFEVEGAGLDEGARTAVALAVAETLNITTSEMLAQRNFEPADVAGQLLQMRPASSYHFSEAEGLLYERIVTESCEYIVDIASQLPHFTEKTLAEILKREGQLITIADRVLQEVARLRAELDPKVEAARFELEYRRAVIRRLDELELFGAGVSVTGRKYSLSLAYIALSLEQQVKQAHRFNERDMLRSPISEEEMMPTTVNKIISVNELLSDAKYLLIRGDAGSGKTTLLQWIAVQSAAQSFPLQLQAWNATIPFYIRLRQHARSDSSALPAWPMPELFPGLVAPAIAGKMPRGWAHQQLEQGYAIVLVDGVDEVPPSQRESVRQWLSDLVITYPLARFILTSRSYAVEEGGLSAEGFKDAHLLPMDGANIEHFIDQWHAAIAENVQDAEEQLHLQDAAERLKEEMRRTRAKRALATNPLLCAMLCALNRERHQQLPSDRIALYEACCELFIERRDVERRILLAEYPAAALSYAQKSLLLSDLAYWLIRNGWSEADLEDVDRRFAQRLLRIPGLQRRIEGSDARLLFVERSGMIREPIKNAIDFAHRTFQEFLAAKAVIDEGDIGVLVQHAHNYQWHEVLILAAGLASKRVREDLVEQLIGRGETEKGYRSQLYLLAAACAQASQEEIGLNIRLRVERRLNALLPLKTAQEVEALAAAGELALPYLHPNLYSSREVTVACVRALIRIGGEGALEVLKKYTNDFTPQVLREIIAGLQDFDAKPAYVQHLFSHIDTLALFDRDVQNISVLSLFPQLTSLTLHGFNISDISALSQVPQLASLTLLGLNISDISALSQLPQLPQLTSLTLNNLNISDISALSQLPQLTSLTLNNLNISDISVLSQLPQLTSLTLSDLKINDISVLSQMPQLTSLTLARLNISNINILTYLPQLTSLTLNNLNISDISVLSLLHRLSSVVLSVLNISDISTLAQMSQIKSIALDGRYASPMSKLSTRLDINDISILSQLPHLTSLELYSLDINNIEVLSKIPHLTSLELYSLDINGISILSQLPHLTSLGMYNLSISDISTLSQLTHLEHLNLYSLDINNIEVLSKIPHLTSLGLVNLNVSNIDILSKIPHLTSLELANLDINDIKFLSQMTRLKYLTLYDLNTSGSRPSFYLPSLTKLIRY